MRELHLQLQKAPQVSCHVYTTQTAYRQWKMANITIPLILLCLFFFFFFFFFVEQSQAHSHHRVVPAIYVFGDSVMDPGNNIFLNTPVKVNFTPYGIDFPNGPTGRFTNGYTIADFWYTWSDTQSHKPIPLPYMDPLSRRNPNTKGFNYASGTAGILPDTGRNIGENLCLGQQVKLFRETAQQYLPSLQAYKNKGIFKLSQVLSKSIFVVCMGSNDYINYLQPGSKTSKLYNAEQFGKFLVKEFGNHLKDLYKLGARKFVVFEIGPVGCLPEVRDNSKLPTLCNEKINGLVSIFNSKLAAVLNELSSKLKGSTFITAKTYQLISDIIHNPHRHGFADARQACCASGINGTGDCVPGTVPCQHRGLHVFWDAVHPTEALYRHIAGECFNGKGLCLPMNIEQLAAKL